MEPQPFFLIVMKKVLYIKLFNKTRKLIVNYFKFFFSFVLWKKRKKDEEVWETFVISHGSRGP